jgi:hypothetical protein
MPNSAELPGITDRTSTGQRSFSQWLRKASCPFIIRSDVSFNTKSISISSLGLILGKLKESSLLDAERHTTQRDIQELEILRGYVSQGTGFRGQKYQFEFSLISLRYIFIDILGYQRSSEDNAGEPSECISHLFGSISGKFLGPTHIPPQQVPIDRKPSRKVLKFLIYFVIFSGHISHSFFWLGRSSYGIPTNKDGTCTN